MERKKILALLGACFNSGQPIKGVNTGPEAIRNSGILSALQSKYHARVKDYGDIHQAAALQQIGGSKTHVNNLDILDPSLRLINNKIRAIAESREEGEVILTVGGDHSVATGTIHGLLQAEANLRVIWVDAHADMSDCSRSDYPWYHGMPLSHLLGINDSQIPGFTWMTSRLRPENVVHIGMRDIDEDEWGTIMKSGIKCFTPDHIDQLGIGQVMRQTIEYLDPLNKHPFHISFDIDGIDPTFSQATGTKYRGGLYPREACHIIRRVVHSRNLLSMDLVQINPSLETGPSRHKYRGEQLYSQNLGATVGMGVDLIDSIFKKYLIL